VLLSEDDQLPSTVSSDPTAVLSDQENEKIVWESVERLPKLWAIAIILFYREDKSIKEIAKIMRVRQNTVKTYLFRGRKRLKEMLRLVIGENIDVA